MGNEINPVPASETPNGTVPTPETGNTPVTGETPGATTTATQTQTLSAEDLQKELEGLKTALKKANQESAAHRHKAKELDDLKAQIESEKLSEKEKLEKRLADLQSAHDNANTLARERIAGYEVRLAASQMGIIDPEVAAALIKPDIHYGEDGTPTNVEELLKDLVKNKSYLVGKPATPTSGGATNPSRSSSTAPQALSWATISSMKPEEYNARRGEIQQWMAKNPPRF